MLSRTRSSVLLRLAEIAMIIVDLGLILSSKFLAAFELNLSSEYELSLS